MEQISSDVWGSGTSPLRQYDNQVCYLVALSED